MQISARNVFDAVVEKLNLSEVSAEVVVKLNGGAEIVSVITANSAKNLGLKNGCAVKIAVKASSVMISTNKDLAISARNIIKGKIANIIKDDVNSEVSLDMGGGQILTANITKNSVEKLGLKVGDTAFGVIKSSSVMIGL